MSASTMKAELHANVGAVGDTLETTAVAADDSKPSKYTDVMLDLETLGTQPGSAIMSIGAVAFAAGMPEAGWVPIHIWPINLASCMAVGLKYDADTLSWWLGQPLEARELFDYATASGPGSVHVVTALEQFTAWFPAGARVWGNGAGFDNVLLACAYRAAAVGLPWRYRDDRCYRTLKNEFNNVPEPEFVGVKHSALDDALHQARHLQAIWAHLRAGSGRDGAC